MSRARILIVEDDVITAKNIKKRLEESEFEVVACITDGKEALKVVQEENPDLVLMDIMLAGAEDGIDTAEQIQSTKKIPIVYLSAYSDKKTLDRAKITQPHGYIVKPFSSQELTSVIEIALYRNEMDRKLIESEARYRSLFQHSPISLWEANFAHLRNYLKDTLNKDSGELNHYFDQNPKALSHCAKKIQIIDINQATRDLFEISSVEEINNKIDVILGSYSDAICKQGIIALMGGQTIFEGVGIHASVSGKKLHVQVKWAVAPGSETDLSKVFVSVLDITEKMRAENARSASEARFRKFIENADDLIYHQGLDGSLDNLNSANFRLTGYSEEEFEKNPQLWQEIVHPDDFESAEQFFKDKAGKVDRHEVEYRIKSVDGQYHWLQSRMVATYDENGKINGYDCIDRDINDLKKANAEIAESEKKFRSVVTHSDAVIFIMDRDGVFELSEGKALKSLGLRPGQVVGQSALEIYKDFPDVVGVIKDALKGNTATVTINLGQNKFNASYNPILDEEGNVIKVIGIATDITDRMKAQEKLLESEERYRQVVESSHDLITIADEKLNTLWANSSWMKVFGDPKKQPHPYERLHPDDKQKVTSAWQNLVAGWGNIVNLEYRYKAEDDKYMTFETTVTRLQFEGQPAFGIFAHNITERKEIENRLRENEEMFSAFLENSPVYIFFKDKDIRSLRLSKNYEKMLGIPIEEAIGKTMNDLFPSDLAKSMIEDDKRILAKGKLIQVFEELDGRHYETSKFPIEIDGEAKMLAGFTIDITEQKKAESELYKALAQSQQQEKEFRGLLTGARSVLEDHTFEVTARHIFDSCCELTGAVSGYVALLSVDGEENELLFLEAGGLPCDVDPELPMPIRGLRAESYKTGKVVYDNDFMNSEWVKFMPEGHVRMDNVLFAPLNIEGRTVGIMGLANKPGGFNENDARIAGAFGEMAAVALKNSQNEEALIEASQYNMQVIESVQEGVVVYGKDLRYQVWNPFMEKRTGKKATEILGKRPLDVFPFLKEIKLDKRLANALKGKVSKPIDFHYDFPEAGKSGWASEITGPLRNVKGEIIGVIGVINEITDRKEAEAAILAEKEKAQQYLDVASVMFIALDQNGTVTLANKKAAEILETTEADIMGKNWFENFIPEWQREELIPVSKKLLSGEIEVAKYYENQVLTRSGKVKLIAWHNSIIKDGSGQIIGHLSSGVDITEKKKAEEELAEKMDELSRFNKLMVGRELKMIELKKEINSLLEERGIAKKYEIPEIV